MISRVRVFLEQEAEGGERCETTGLGDGRRTGGRVMEVGRGGPDSMAAASLPDPSPAPGASASRAHSGELVPATSASRRAASSADGRSSGSGTRSRCSNGPSGAGLRVRHRRPEHRPQRPQIGSGPRPGPRRTLRSDEPGEGLPAADVSGATDPEVGHHHPSAPRFEKHIGGLEVPVDDADAMGGVEGTEDGEPDPGGLGGR